MMHAPSEKSSHNQSLASKVFVSACFIIILLLASFDASAIDGIVPLIQQNFNVNDAQTATIRTASSVTQTVTLGFIWIFGDIFSRRKLFLSTLSLWIFFSLLSIILGSDSFLIFIVFRSLAAVPLAVFEVLIPVMVADLFTDRALGVAFMLMKAGELISAQVTGVVSSWIVTSGVPWQSGLIAGPLLTIVPLLSLLCMKSHLRNVETFERNLKKSFNSAFEIFSIKSFVLLTAVISLAFFHVKSVRFWFPTMVLTAWEQFSDAFYGFSYTTVITINNFVKLAGLLIGMPLFLWFAQSWRHATALFSGRDEFVRAYPIVVSAAAVMNASMYLLSFIVLVENYFFCVISLFFVGLGASADASLNQQMMMMVVPISSRPAAVALNKLISGLVTIPAAQLIGMVLLFPSLFVLGLFISHTLSQAMMCSTLFAFASCIFDFALIGFFPSDHKRAAEKDREELQTVDERTALVEKPKERSESLMDALVRSRAATVDSYL